MPASGLVGCQNESGEDGSAMGEVLVNPQACLGSTLRPRDQDISKLRDHRNHGGVPLTGILYARDWLILDRVMVYAISKYCFERPLTKTNK